MPEVINHIKLKGQTYDLPNVSINGDVNGDLIVNGSIKNADSNKSLNLNLGDTYRGGVTVSRINFVDNFGEKQGHIAPITAGDNLIQFVTDAQDTNYDTKTGFRFIIHDTSQKNTQYSYRGSETRLSIDPHNLYFYTDIYEKRKNILNLPTSEGGRIEINQADGRSGIEITNENIKLKAFSNLICTTSALKIGKFGLTDRIFDTSLMDWVYDTSSSGIYSKGDNIHLNYMGYIFHQHKYPNASCVTFEPKVKCKNGIDIWGKISDPHTTKRYISFNGSSHMILSDSHIHLGPSVLKSKLYHNDHYFSTFALIGNQGEINMASDSFNTIIQTNGKYHIRYATDPDITKKYVNKFDSEDIGWNSYRFLIDKDTVSLKTSPNTQISIQEKQHRINMVANDFRFVFKELKEDGTGYKENGTDTVALLSEMLKDIENLKAFHYLNNKVAPVEGDIQIFLDPDCTKYATGRVNTLYARINKAWKGLNSGWSYLDKYIGVDGGKIDCYSPSTEYPEDEYGLCVYVDFTTNYGNRPFEDGEIVKLTTFDMMLIDVTGFRTVFYKP